MDHDTPSRESLPRTVSLAASPCLLQRNFIIPGASYIAMENALRAFFWYLCQPPHVANAGSLQRFLVGNAEKLPSPLPRCRKLCVWLFSPFFRASLSK